ncbi:hypothetical protein GW756_03275 [bacterium]|nr:hypothetical protein [bacterium]NCQ55461.1 hypothetical protein [Candidatus Parcubacteria bacterium]NCS67823.1 hypothetical protein [Candidatus Peregrinibacteria bacterium]NCS96363.1 hypothetical protein [bacterium]
MHDFTLLPKLIKASGAMDDVKKRWLLDNISRMSDTKKAEIFDILKAEQEKKNVVYKKLISKRKEYETKRAQTIYRYIERKVNEEEESTMEDIDKELALL